jgi:hypothetical protein
MAKQILMKIPSVAAELFHADGQTGGHGEGSSCFLKLCKHA